MKRKYEFHMPDGSIINSCKGVDEYYNLSMGVTRHRLERGWTGEECARNKKHESHKYEFHMPDGSILNTCRDVDRYYNLKIGVTNQRVLRYSWSEEECARNKKHKSHKYEFHMPDGSILNTCKEVDEYYNLSKNSTSYRLGTGWTEEECANNRRAKKSIFRMPDGSTINTCNGVDRYYNLCIGTTGRRLKTGWTKEECSINKRVKKWGRYEFHMPDGNIMNSCIGVDRYYNLSIGITSRRLKMGWTEEECANNKRIGGRKKYEYEFHMPNGSTLTSPEKVDRYYNLGKNNTRQRLKNGWTVEECANNKRVNGNKKYGKYEFHMPDGSILTSPEKVDRYYNLCKTVTRQRLSRGWAVEECANNKRIGGYRKYKFHMPDGSILTSCSDVDRFYNLKMGTTNIRLRYGWTEEECANNEDSGYIIT